MVIPLGHYDTPNEYKIDEITDLPSGCDSTIVEHCFTHICFTNVFHCMLEFFENLLCSIICVFKTRG